MTVQILNETQKDLFLETMISRNIGDFFYEKKREGIKALGKIAVIQQNAKNQDDRAEKIAEIDAANAWATAKNLLNNNKIDLIMTHSERQKKNINDAFDKAQNEKIKELVVFAEEVVKEIKAVENGASTYDAEDKIKSTKAHK